MKQKKILTFMLALCMLLSLIPSASAVNNTYVINGVSVSPSSGTSAWNCSTYASQVLKKIWVVNAVMTTYGCPYNLLNGKNANERRITEDTTRKYIQETPLGSRIRICASSDTTTNNYDNSKQGHTMVLVAKDDFNGSFTVLQAGSGFATDTTFTYSSFADYWINKKGYGYFFYISDYSAAATNVGQNNSEPLTSQNPWTHSSTPTRVISYAATGNDVKWLQQALNIVMKSGLAVDGSAGPATSRAIKAFQAKYNLTVDGSFGPASRQKMVSVLNSMKYTMTSSPDPNTPNSSVPDSIQDPPPTPAKYTVTLNANGGSVSTSSITVTEGSTYQSLPTPTRNDYIFDGWFTAADGGSRVSGDSRIIKDENHTLYAHWAPKFSEKKTPWDFSDTPSRTLYYGVSRGSDVKWLQQALNDVIDVNLDVDGSVGPITADAIKQFQARYGLEQDGYFGPACRAAIINALNKMGYYPPTSIPESTLSTISPWAYSPTPTRDILYRSPNMSGNDIKWLQQALNIVIDAGLEIDGIAGPATGNAIKAFQAKYGLSQDGSFGPASRAAMVKELNNLGYTN